MRRLRARERPGRDGAARLAAAGDLELRAPAGARLGVVRSSRRCERLYPGPRRARASGSPSTPPTSTPSRRWPRSRSARWRRSRSGAPPASRSDAAAMARVKDVLGSSLAALGDRLFWFTLRPFARLLGRAAGAGAGAVGGAVALWLCYNVVHSAMRFGGRRLGLPARAGGAGPGAAPRLERADRAGRPCWARAAGRRDRGGAAGAGRRAAARRVPGHARGRARRSGCSTAQRARPSPTEWALGAGGLCVVAAWLRGEPRRDRRIV